MGYYSGIKERLPDEYDPWWEERENISDLHKMWHLGHESGFSAGLRDNTRSKKDEQEIDTLRALLAANVRVIKEELRKELLEEHSNINT